MNPVRKSPSEFFFKTLSFLYEKLEEVEKGPKMEKKTSRITRWNKNSPSGVIL